MKRFLFLLLAVGLVAPSAHAQDAATDERLDKLAGQIEDLQAASVQTQKRIADLAKDLEELKDGQGKAGANYATQDDIKKLTAALQDIDQKRVDDNDKIVKEIEKLGKLSSAPPKKDKPITDTTPASGTTDKGYDYVIKNNDTLSSIVSAYHDQNIKVTVDSILKANPNLKANSLRVGQKIFIPAPTQ
jgi:LysM repeat protein